MFNVSAKEAKPTEYLYGVSPLYFENLTYKDILEAKISLAQKRIAKLTDELVYVIDYDKSVEISQNIQDCLKAIEFNKSLLKEFNCAKGVKCMS